MVPLKIELPDGFLEEEVRCGYTVSKQMKEVWAVELDLLAELLRVCKKHNIKIFASGGTLLGAIRHGGFIPWDDDIDMMMFRKDYDKLCSVAETEFKHPYFFQTEHTDPGSLRFHAQLRNSMTTAMLTWEKNDPNSISTFNQGIFIDIFPLDNISDGLEQLNVQKRAVRKYKKIIIKLASITRRYSPYAHTKINTIIKRLIHTIGGFLIDKFELEEKYYRKYENECKKYNTEETEHIGFINFALIPDFNKKEFKKRREFSDVKNIKFEFLSIPINSGYEDELRRQYGDYMKYKIGKNTHGGVFFDTSMPYTKYTKEINRNKLKGLSNCCLTTSK